MAASRYSAQYALMHPLGQDTSHLRIRDHKPWCAVHVLYVAVVLGKLPEQDVDDCYGYRVSATTKLKYMTADCIAALWPLATMQTNTKSYCKPAC